MRGEFPGGVGCKPVRGRVSEQADSGPKDLTGGVLPAGVGYAGGVVGLVGPAAPECGPPGGPGVIGQADPSPANRIWASRVVVATPSS
jgi:hypothetical protein